MLLICHGSNCIFPIAFVSRTCQSTVKYATLQKSGDRPQG
jgi:hypothetical protein